MTKETIKIPLSSNSKVAAISIGGFSRFSVNNFSEICKTGIYNVNALSLNINCALFRNETKSKKLYVFFSGFVNRQQTQLPAFHRWSWHNQFDGHTLYISDPMLEETTNLGLGWYIGSCEIDLINLLGDLVNDVARNLNVDECNIIFYGSSGGGFAAIRMLSLFSNAASISINPQTTLTSFEGKALQDYLNVFFNGISKVEFAERYPARNELAEIATKIEYSSIVYAQNLVDPHHINKHLPALFKKEDSGWQPKVLKNVSLLFFDDDRGHGVAEPNALVPEFISEVERMQNKKFFRSL